MADDTEIDHIGIRYVYEQVASAIAARIAAGYYPVKLPSERALAEEFGVSYVTVRRVMAILRERDLIVSVHGRGTFVSESVRNSN
jgi:GntR family transcriptional regulator